MNFSITYSDDKKTITLLDNQTAIMIFDSLPNVENIGKRACFEGCLKKLDLRKTNITTIKSEAFGDCKNLTEIYLPESLQIIESNAFLRTSPTEIYIPPKVYQMTGYAWNQINTLEQFDVDEKNTFFSSEQGFLYDYNKTKLIKAPCFFKTSSDIPYIDAITAIGEYCFTDVQIISFKCKRNIQTIEQRVFHVLRYLRYIDLSLSSITTLPSYVFNDCRELYFVKLPFTLEIIESNLFSIHAKLHSIYIYPYVKTINSSCFEKCPELRTIYYYGKNDFSNIKMCSETTEPNNVIVYVTFMYNSNKFGEMNVIKKHADFIKTCKVQQNINIKYIACFIFYLIS